jgi:hypothetical protein
MSPTPNQHRLTAFVQKSTAFTIRHACLGWLPLCLIAGLISVAFGQDASWDLQNYHLYNAFALFHPHRQDVDIAQIQTFLNPLLDIPLYLLNAAFPHAPRLIAFCMGLPFGLLAFFSFRVGSRLFGARRHNTLIAALFGLTGSATVSQIGLSSNEIQVAVLVVAGFDCMLAAIQDRAVRLAPLLLAGLLTGLAAGAKLTAAPYAIGLAAAALCALPSRRLPVALTIIGAAGALGIAAAGGPWMAHLTAAYGNPIFPYDNQIFQSGWAGLWGYNDTRFFPSTMPQWLFFPYRWALPNAMVVTELRFADPRFAAVFAAGPMAVLAVLFRGRLAALLPPPHWRAVIIFWLVSYIGWETLFSIYRYTIPLELLGGMLVIGAVNAVLGTRPRATVAASLLTAAICAATIYPDWGHVPFRGASLPVRMPALPPRGLIVSTGASAVSFLALRAPRDTVFVAANSNFVVPENTLTWRRITAAIATWKGPIDIIEPAQGDPLDRDIVAGEFDLIASQQCQTIIAAWNANGLRLCAAHFGGNAADFQRPISVGFAAGDPGAADLRAGWDEPEAFGRWTDAADATIVLPVNPANTRPLRLTMLAFSTPTAAAPGRQVDVFANGRPIAHWAIAAFTAASYQATIPSLGGAAQLTLHFHIADAAARFRRPDGSFGRAVGMAAIRLSLREILTNN